MADFKTDEIDKATAAVADVKLEDEEAKPEFPQFPWLPPGKKPLADGEYDCIVMGTGLKECVLSGLLATAGKKVLHVDRNSYYGADSASLNLSNLFAKFNNGKQPHLRCPHNNYNVDLIQSASCVRKLVKMLIHTRFTITWISVAGRVLRASERQDLQGAGGEMEVVSNGYWVV